MRILQVIEFFTPKMGGSVQVAYQIARHLSKRGHEVTVCSSDYGREEAAFSDVPFEAVLLPTAFSRWGFYVTPVLIRWARQHLRKFDVIHLHNVRTFQNLIVSAFARRYGIPYVLSAHGSLPVIVQRKVAKRVYDLLFGRRLIAGASRLIAVSPVEMEQYAAWGVDPDRIAMIPNGLDLDDFSHLPPRGEFRRRLGIPDSVKIVLFLGRLHRVKGLTHLIQAFAWLRTRLGDCILVIAGPDDGELARLRTLANGLGLREQVMFVGPVYGEEKLAAYVDADVLASPAAYEIFGLVPFEALMCGTPVVVADGCGSGHLVRRAQAGCVVPYGDVEALGEALLKMVTDGKEANKMIQAGQEYIREHLDWQAILNRLEEVYIAVV